jgi:hypothetical protein
MIEQDFCAMILTHGRPGKVFTYDTLRRQGYTGRIVVVIDNEDSLADEYHKAYGDQVYVFDKAAVASRMDQGDNFDDRRSIVFARNASFEIAKELGIKYFIQLDDDYTEFRYRKDHNYRPIKGRVDYIRSLNSVFDAMLSFYKATPIMSVAMSQGGDFIGGADGKDAPKRKCMNSFILSTDRPFKFVGRINEDVNTYTRTASTGNIFLTLMMISLQQKQTQSNSGGMTDLYLDSGTYIKSIYSVIYQPSSVKVAVLQDRKAQRLHHRVNWDCTVPKLIKEEHKKL